jgi:hypothetical protein
MQNVSVLFHVVGKRFFKLLPFIAIPLWISNICIAHSAMAPLDGRSGDSAA